MLTQTRTNEFLNPGKLLSQIPITPNMQVADFGCGNGFYAIAAARMVGKKGQVYALDILEDCLSQVGSMARLSGIQNISTRQCNLENFGLCDLPDTCCDVVIVSNLLYQAENREAVLREAYRTLKTSGKLLIVEWRPESRIGPDHGQRIKPETVRELLEHFSFRPAAELPAGSFHYALLYSK